MVMLEQTWVFWLGDNLLDMEMGLKLCEKAEKLLAEEKGVHLGLALYWRFMVEHKLLQYQVDTIVSIYVTL